MSDELRPDEQGRLLRFIASTVELNRERLDALYERVDSLHDSLSGRIDALSERVDSNHNSLSARVDSLYESAVTKDEFRVQATAIRGDIEQVQLRLDSILDRARPLSAHGTDRG